MTSFSQNGEQFSLDARSVPDPLLLLLLFDSFTAPRLSFDAVDSFVRAPGDGHVPKADGLVFAAGSEQVGIRGVEREVEDGLSSGVAGRESALRDSNKRFQRSQRRLTPPWPVMVRSRCTSHSPFARCPTRNTSIGRPRPATASIGVYGFVVMLTDQAQVKSSSASRCRAEMARRLAPEVPQKAARGERTVPDRYFAVGACTAQA